MAQQEEEVCRVLSVQSHVVHGYVGNKAAVFPLQLLGYDVDAINSVQFSNHTWYKVFKGQVLNDADLADLYRGLKENDLHHYNYVLTGYIGADSFLLKVHDIVKELKKEFPGLKYVCDPVMGDNDVWYVPKELLPIYQTKILPLADIIVPNQWEAEQLTGMTIKTEADAIAAIKALHAKGPQSVILSSTELGDAGMLVGYASVIRDGKRRSIKMSIPRLDAMFIGTGDLFAALWLAWSHRHGDDLQLVASKVQSTLKLVLDRTLKSAQKRAGPGQKPSWQDLELRLIQSKKDIENPELCVKAVSLGEEVWKP